MSDLGRCRGAALLSVLAIALLAGCGSGDSTDSAASGPLTKAQYLKEGNQICKKGGEAKDQAVKKNLEELPQKELTGGFSKKTAKKFTENLLPYAQKIVTELAELQPPAKDKATVDKFMKELEAASTKAEAEPLLLAESDPFNDAAKGARAYGLTDCII